jgi:anthranilate synthase/aminodeoxychorismate synthase-like glutamine amidotransferase
LKNLLLIDCYDSFTDILAQTLENTGVCRVEICPYDALNPLQFPFYDAFVLSPGPGLPYEYPQIFAALQQLKDRPVLGICMGHQILGLACGGRLQHLSRVNHGQTKHLKQLQKDVLFKDISQNTAIGLYHSWVLKDLPTQLSVLACSEDNNVMMIRHENYPWVGFQFHPESYMTNEGVNLLSNWIKMI